MSTKEIYSKIKNLLGELSKYEKGDLFKLYEIVEIAKDLIKNIEKINNFEEEKVAKINEIIKSDIMVTNDDLLITLMNKYFSTINSYIDNIIDKKIFNENISKIYEETSNILDKNVIEKKSNIYPENYFENIVDDKNMIITYCTELNEHMELSQITLVELEYDPTNKENINKVFRAFHTAKSSSAFLGFKNIEEVAHSMEDMLALIRDGKLRINKELIDVIFYGINLFKDFINIIQRENYDKTKFVEIFKSIDIYNYINIVKNIIKNYNVKKIGEILEEEGKINQEIVKNILDYQEEKQTGEKFGEIAVKQNYISQKDLEEAVYKQNRIVSKNANMFVKVSNKKLNELIDLVGELVIVQSMLRQTKADIRSEIKDSFNDSAFSQLEKITISIKNIVLSMGMVPISEIFNKLKVVVRNTSNESGKIVNLIIKGESTELDRNIIENLYDPLVHIVRNAIDHGIESPEERVKNGKDKVGNLKIEALHKGNNIEIHIIDDGKGINKEKVIEKALSKNLITHEIAGNLQEKDIFNLLFLPGFSTADKVTELSGRGVGLDVVKKNIEAIRGKVEIKSITGKFTEFIIKLPLTLAIIDGFITLINNVKYIFPFNIIEEIIISEKSKITKMEDGQLMLFLRGTYIPVIFGGKIVNERFYKTELDKLLFIIINYQTKFYAIAVDSIIGKQEIVIKNLSDFITDSNVFSGGTIFGDGTIGFVIDIENFMDKAFKYN